MLTIYLIQKVLGLTGKFVFDEFGYRTNIELGLYELGENGLVKVRFLEKFKQI